MLLFDQSCIFQLLARARFAQAKIIRLLRVEAGERSHSHYQGFENFLVYSRAIIEYKNTQPHRDFSGLFAMIHVSRIQVPDHAFKAFIIVLCVFSEASIQKIVQC